MIIDLYASNEEINLQWDLQRASKRAIRTVLKQAELLCSEWVIWYAQCPTGQRFRLYFCDFLREAAAIMDVPMRKALEELGERGVYLNFGNPKNSRSYPITPKIPKYRRLNLTKNRYQQTPRNMPNFTLIPRCRGKVSSSHCAAAPRFLWSWTSRPTRSSGGPTFFLCDLRHEIFMPSLWDLCVQGNIATYCL